jgi:hypothetical protein
MEIAVIIPALSEESSLAALLGGLPEGLLARTIAVHDGSSDRTARMAEAAGARVIGEESRAVDTGMRARRAPPLPAVQTCWFFQTATVVAIRPS